jgi:D-glycero-D-manno-heptose 1,7-bisphosphate phosphatase
MLLKAAEDFNIDLEKSWMIGDGENDVKAGRTAGCKTVLVNGEGSAQKEGDFGQNCTYDSVLEFVEEHL